MRWTCYSTTQFCLIDQSWKILDQGKEKSSRSKEKRGVKEKGKKYGVGSSW